MSDPYPVDMAVVSSENSLSIHEYEYKLQSEEIKEIIGFIDESVTKFGDGAANHVFSTHDQTSDTELAAFLQRPVRINTVTWLESDTRGILQTGVPWFSWANEPTVKNKLNNYAFLRGDLHLKFIVSASPFYYGRMKMVYLPLPAITPSTISPDAGFDWFINQSQRPHVVIDPQNQESVEMVLPMIFHKNWLNVQLASDFSGLGSLDYTIYSRLESANAAVGTGVTIATYAWIENLQLSGASAGFSMQSDEYGDGCVSAPASRVASVATYMEKIPIIGPFATATRIGASAVSLIAKLFGYTNVPVISDSVPQRPEPFPKMASSDIGYPVEKLTLDPKNELSIDPRIVGRSDPTDELSIQHLCSKESYLSAARWASSDAVDVVLFYSRVNPKFYDSDALTQIRVAMTPMCWVSNMFAHWRGDIIFRFKVVCSKYHKGRLRVSFDPAGYNAQNIGNTTNTSNVVHTAIIDIGETTDVEFRVPYQQATQFLALRQSVAESEKGWAVNAGVPATYPYDKFYDNGFITVRVLNILTAPVASSGVDVLIYVRAAENFELANPANIDQSNRFSYFAPQSYEYVEQSEEYATHDNTDSFVLGNANKTTDNQYTVHFGENIRSLRQLVRRMELHSSNRVSFLSAVQSQMQVFNKTFYRYPACTGYLASGTENANMIVGVGTYRYNFAQFTYLNWIMPAFLCYRGSINWTFNIISPERVMHNMRVLRDNASGTIAAYASSTYTTTYAGDTARNSLLSRDSGAPGQALTNCLTNSGLNVQCPNYSTFKFQSTSPAKANQGVAEDGSVLDLYRLELICKTEGAGTGYDAVLDNYVAAGTDFSVYHFINVPTIFQYSVLPSSTP